MANDTIGSLVAVTTVTAGQFTAGMKEIESSLDETHSHAESLDWGEAFKLDVAFEAIHEGIELAKESIEGFFESLESVSQLKNFSEAVGATTQEIQGLRYAAQQFDISAESVDNALQKMQKNIGALNAGDAGITKVFAEIGLSAKDFIGLDADQALLKTGEAIKKLNNASDEAYISTEIFGKSAGRMVALFNSGTEAINKNIEAAKAAGLVYGDDDVEAAEKANVALKNLHSQWSAFTDHLIAAAAPILTAIANELRELGTYLTAHAEEIAKAAIGWARTAVEIGAVILIVPEVVGAIKGIIEALEAMAEAESFAEALSGPEGIAALAVGLAAGGSAVLVLNNQFNKLQAGADAAAASIKKAVEEAGKAKGNQASTLPAQQQAAKDAAEIKKLAEETEKAADKMQESIRKHGVEITNSLRTPMEKYRDAIVDAKAALENQAISQQTYNRAVAKATEELNKANEAKQEFQKTEGVGAAVVGTTAGFSAVAAGQRLAEDLDRQKVDLANQQLEQQQQMVAILGTINDALGGVGGMGGGGAGAMADMATADF